MATNTLASRVNLYDVQKLKAPNGGAVDITNTLIETNDLLKDLPALPANGGLFHQGARVSALPTGSLVNIGGSWSSSKSERTPFVEALATVRSRFQSPKDVLETEGAEVSKALVESEKRNHIESLGQAWANLMIHGPVTQQNGIVGLMNRAPFTSIDTEHTFDVGGSGSYLRSAWLMQPDPATVHLAYNPNHPTLGVEMKDKGEVFVTNPAATAIDGAAGRWDIIIEFMMQEGLVIRDQRAVKRIANIPCGPSDTPTADLVANVIRASLRHSGLSSKMWFLYCDTEVYTQLVLGANEKLKVYMSDKNIYQTVLPMIGTNIIIRRCDAIATQASGSLTYETEVS
jgi:hypothetical protein